MGLFDFFKGSSRQDLARRAEHNARIADIQKCLQSGDVPASIKTRLEGARNGTLPWVATLTPAELSIVRSHGLRPITTVSATCWLHYGWALAGGPAQGWELGMARRAEEGRGTG